FACHGPDAKKRKAKLRLDVFDPSLTKNEILVPGHADKSELGKRLQHKSASKRMPPAKSGKKLTAAQIATLKQWINEGASSTQHWAYSPPKRPALPVVKNTSWSRNAIDRFILAKLEKTGLSPSREADRIRLLRRVTLDLTGLPPTLDEVDAYLADKKPGAY